MIMGNENTPRKPEHPHGEPPKGNPGDKPNPPGNPDPDRRPPGLDPGKRYG